MVDELSGGKMMYAYLRVKDPNTQLYKNVLVNWVSPNMRLSCVSSHTHTPLLWETDAQLCGT